MKTQETTSQWWDKVSNSNEEMVNWLKSQYHGEVTAGLALKLLASFLAHTPANGADHFMKS